MESSLESNQSMNEQEDSPHSGDESTAAADAPSAKTSRRAPQKKVMTVPVGETDGSRSKGEVYPPSDSWSWRKYGQKPIKGSPYPRAYYRCSSSKGCPARKQVERSRLDPTMLLITYCYEHNHPPLPTKPHHPTTTVDSEISLEDRGTDSNVHQLDMRRLDNSSPLANDLLDDLGWFSDIFMCIDEPMFVGPTWEDADMAIMLPIGEEDDALFGELGELPECSFIFRQCTIKNSYYGSTG